MRVVVTGGTGFIGSALCRRLRERGDDVRVVSRSLGFDITSKESLAPAFRDAEVVFHLAALVQSRPGPFDAVNLQGLSNVLGVSEAARVSRFIYVSSFTVFGPSGEVPHDERSLGPRTTFFHGYDRSKYEALQLARSWADRMAINAVFPTVVFGPGPLTEGNILVRMIGMWLRFGVAPLPGKGLPRWNFVFVDDVAASLVAVAEGLPGRDYIVGGENRSLAELVQEVRRASGRKIRCLGIPDGLFRLSAYADSGLSRLAGRPPLLHPSTVRFMLANWEYSNAAACRELGVVPRTLAEGLAETVKWLNTKTAG